MNVEAPTSVLRLMAQARAPATPDVPLTASRAVRLAMTRGAENAIGLAVTVSSVAEEVLTLDELLAALNDDLLMVRLQRGNSIIGVVACDYPFAAAAVEVQTTGFVSSAAPPQRAVTGTDMSLTQPIFSGFLSELSLTTPRTALDNWATDVVVGNRFDEVRRVGFDLIDVSYRMIRLSLDMGGDNRVAQLLMALPIHGQPVPVVSQSRPAVDWTSAFQSAVNDAPATLDAVLHKFRMPLKTATNLEVGQILPLPGCTVGSVRLVAPGGQTVARARLGQIAGQIAVRLQDEEDHLLSEMPSMGGGVDLGGMAEMPDMMDSPGLMDSPDMMSSPDLIGQDDEFPMMQSTPMMDDADDDADDMMAAPMMMDTPPMIDIDLDD